MQHEYHDLRYSINLHSFTGTMPHPLLEDKPCICFQTALPHAASSHAGPLHHTTLAARALELQGGSLDGHHGGPQTDHPAAQSALKETLRQIVEETHRQVSHLPSGCSMGLRIRESKHPNSLHRFGGDAAGWTVGAVDISRSRCF